MSWQISVLTSEWTLLTWECRFPRWENDAGQNMHRWGFSPVCLAMWVCSTTFWLKAFPQWLHLKGLSPGGKIQVGHHFNIAICLYILLFFTVDSWTDKTSVSLSFAFKTNSSHHQVKSCLESVSSTLRLSGGQPNKLGCRLWVNT